MRTIDLKLGKKFLQLHNPIQGVTKEKNMTTTTIKTFKNEYDVNMLEIKEEHRRPVRISEKKALAILATNEDASQLTAVVKHGRDLFQVAHLEGERTFVVGEKKIRLCLDNAEGINSALEAV